MNKFFQTMFFALPLRHVRTALLLVIATLFLASSTSHAQGDYFVDDVDYSALTLVPHTLSFEAPDWFYTSWNENGKAWNITGSAWGDIRGYDPHSGTFHLIFAATGQEKIVSTDENIDVQGFWFEPDPFCSTFTVTGYDANMNVLYTIASVLFSPFGYQYVPLSWTGVRYIAFSGTSTDGGEFSPEGSFFVDDIAYTIAEPVSFSTLSFEAPDWFYTSWTENGKGWNITGSAWGDIRGYDPHSGTFHLIFAATGQEKIVSTDENIDVQGFWFEPNPDCDTFSVRGYDGSMNLLYSIPSVPFLPFGYQYVTLNWTNVRYLAFSGTTKPAKVSGNVWYDKNHNQLKDATETGMSGIQIDATPEFIGPSGSAITNVNGDYTLTVFVDTFSDYVITQSSVPSGYMQVFPKVGGYNLALFPGEEHNSKNFGNSAAATANEYRTASYQSWANAVDSKDKQKAEKRKDHIVEMKFNIVAPHGGYTGFELDFGMVTEGEVTEGKDKLVLVGTPMTGQKKYSFSGLVIDSSDTFQIDAIGLKGKTVKAKVKWTGRTAKPLTFKQTITEYKKNDPHPRMPNLNNVGEELFGGPKNYTQANYFPTGLLVGTPQGEKFGKSVIHFKYKDVMKSLNAKGQFHTADDGCLDLIGGKPMLKQQKSLPPNKVDSKLFAELLTAKLNVAASVLNKFPNGLGELVYLDKANPLNPFNDQSVNEIIAKGDSIISCLPVTTKDSVPTTSDLYDVLAAINVAFDGPVDTISYATKTALTGVADLKSCTYLYAVPGVIPASTVPGKVIDQTPVAYQLDQNYPNPFNPLTTIEFSLPNSGLVSLKVYNMLGQEVAALLDNVEFEDGQQSVDFDGSALASGVYFYRLSVQPITDEEGALQGESFTQVKKMLLMK